MKKIIILLISISTFVVCQGQTKENSTNGKIYLVNAEQFKKGIAKEGVQLVDVRTLKEYNQGKIGNAILINFFQEDFMEKINKLDKNKPIYIYCHSGRRSGRAAKKLLNAGFENIYNLDGGIIGWRNR